MDNGALPGGSDNGGVRVPFIRREISVGNILLCLPMLGAIGAGIWEGGRIQATMQDGITQERDQRLASDTATNDRIKLVLTSMDELRKDVRELREYVMVKAEFPTDGRKTR
jgi:hypothetical protein